MFMSTVNLELWHHYHEIRGLIGLCLTPHLISIRHAAFRPLFITSVSATLKRAYDEVLKIGATELTEFKHNQQDATLHSGIYYYKCSTCFRRFLRPSSGVQKCIHSIGYLSSFFCFLPLSCVSCSSLKIAVRSSKTSTNTRCSVYSFELLMMDGGTAWNM